MPELRETTLPFPVALVAAIPALRRTARALVRCPDRAEDITQEALLRVWARMRDGEEIAAPLAYLRATARNLARRPPRLDPAEAASPESTPPCAEDRLACRAVMAALAALPPEQAALLTSAALGEGTVAEIAIATGLPPGTVASRVSRARARLRRDLGLPETRPVGALLDR